MGEGQLVILTHQAYHLANISKIVAFVVHLQQISKNRKKIYQGFVNTIFTHEEHLRS